MIVKFINDGQPESGEFDENYVEVRAAPAAHREWRELPLIPGIRARSNVRTVPQNFQSLEIAPPQISNHWKPGFIRRLFC